MTSLTVAIPVYNREEYFVSSLRSALEQTVSVPVLVVDNASNSPFFQRICGELHAQFPMLKYVRNEHNVGMFANWNRCFELAETDYVCILGDDDLLDSRYAERALAALAKRPQPIVYYSNFDVIVNGRHAEALFVIKEFGAKSAIELVKASRRARAGLPTLAACYKRDLMVQKPLRASHHGSNDWLWWYELEDDFPVYGDAEVLMHYRKHAASDTASEYVKVIGQAFYGPVFEYLSSRHFRGREFFNIRLSAGYNCLRLIVKHPIHFHRALKANHFIVRYLVAILTKWIPKVTYKQ